jgi:glutamate-5-semialdehyde dehydrogenase
MPPRIGESVADYRSQRKPKVLWTRVFVQPCLECRRTIKGVAGFAMDKTPACVASQPFCQCACITGPQNVGRMLRSDFLVYPEALIAYVRCMTLTDQMIQLGRQARQASKTLAILTSEQKNACLRLMADGLIQEQRAILEANELDVQTGIAGGLSSAMVDRLKLDPKRIAGMARGLNEVAALPDPVGRLLDERQRPNGLQIRKVATPIGVIVILFESRPNVTADAAGLCFKSGNATILRGGKEAVLSNQAIAGAMLSAARSGFDGFPPNAIQVVSTTDRDAIRELLALTQYIDLCIPRGGEGLIRAVTECSRVPVIKHYKGVCHVYVHEDADLEMAEEITINAKVQRPGVCNAIETLLVDKAVAPKFLPHLAQRLIGKKVELRVDASSLAILETTISGLKAATEEDWYAEYLDLILAVRVVEGLPQAIDHINHYGSAHSDCIVTRNEAAAKRFLSEVDSAVVYWNASTRFTDGGEFGMGAEIGISTDKIGARGPMGLEELTTYKWICCGNGQIRG